jgi:hypothetical protein
MWRARLKGLAGFTSDNYERSHPNPLVSHRVIVMLEPFPAIRSLLSVELQRSMDKTVN